MGFWDNVWNEDRSSQVTNSVNVIQNRLGRDLSPQETNFVTHAITSADITNSSGRLIAVIAGDLREVRPNNDNFGAFMDQLANETGRRAAGEFGENYHAISIAIADALANGVRYPSAATEAAINAHQGNLQYNGLSEFINIQLTHASAVGAATSFDRPHCFLAGTMIDMWPLDMEPDADRIYDEQEVLAKVWKKSIEEVTPEDWVLSYDDKGRLKPGRVTRTFQNHSKHILDVHGLMVTPGHATYCAKVEGEENPFADSHVPIIDILRSDGALMKSDGTLVRAATDCVVGSKDDEKFWAFLLYEDKDGAERVREKCQLRLGTRWMMPNGSHFSMREYMNSIGVELIEDGPQKGYVRFKKTGVVTVFAWVLSESLPKPEDYVLQLSQVTLEEIYEADEWEAVRPQIPAPFMGESGRSYNRDTTSNTGLYAGATSTDHLPPNIPHSMRNSPNQPTMSRKQRRVIESKKRKNAKKSKRAATLH